MRMRKKKWAIPFLQENENVVIKNPEQYKGKWKEKFNKDILHLEIGTGKGSYIYQMSNMYQNEAFIGIEKEQNVAAVAAKKLVNDYKDNRVLIAQDAKDILNWFDDEEIDIIHLNFSDPWPKKSTTKRRLSSKGFIDIYSKILKKDGVIIMKSDNASLFEYSVVEFNNNGFLIEDISVDYRRNKHDEDAITEYELKFMELNQPIYRMVLRRKV